MEENQELSQITGHAELLTNDLDEIPNDRPLRLQELLRLQSTSDMSFISGIVHISITDKMVHRLNSLQADAKEKVRAEILEAAKTAYDKLVIVWSEMQL